MLVLDKYSKKMEEVGWFIDSNSYVEMLCPPSNIEEKVMSSEQGQRRLTFLEIFPHAGSIIFNI